MSASEALEAAPPTRGKRPRSAITSGRKLFIAGDPNSEWSRRYHDLIVGHINDLGGRDMLSEAQLSLIRRASSIECELERLDALLSLGQPVDLPAYASCSSHLRRLFEVLGLKRQPRTVNEPTLGDLLRADQEEQRRVALDEEPNDGA